MDPLPPDPKYLSRLAFPEKNFIGQIVAEMLTMVCHRRLRGIDQEAFIIHAYHSELRLFHATFPASYITSVLDTGVPDRDLSIYKTRGYEMLEPTDRATFLDILVALFRKLEAGEVRTGFAWREFPDNPVMNAPPEMHDLIFVSPPSSSTTSTLELPGPPSALGSKSRSPIRKRKSRSPVKHTTRLEKGLNEFGASGE